MDIFFPPDLPVAAMAFGIDDFTAVDESATTGGMQSSALYGTRRWRLRMDFQTLSRSNGSLARFESLIASLRGRGNRVWIGLAQQKLRGSFPATEMFANNDFSGGVASWTPDSAISLSALDHGARATRLQMTSANILCGQAVTKLAGVPYAIRGFVGGGKITTVWMSDNVATTFGPLSQGMIEGAFTTPANSSSTGFFDFTTSGEQAGSFADLRWASFSRCAQVDNGVNLLLNSDTPGTGTGWSLNAATAATASAAGPDGATDAWGFTETTANSAHQASQVISVAAGALDYSFSIFVAPANRSWCYLSIFDGTNSASAWFNATTVATGSSAIGTNFTLISQQIVNCGNGWSRIILTLRKSSAATSLTIAFGSATADGVSSFVGVASLSLKTWRASFAQSSVAVQPIQTAGTAQTGTLQTGYTLNLKGLPVATQGLLLEGDVVECLMPTNSQLLRAVARLDSDAAGLGTLIFENALKQSPADGAGVVVQQPMGRFVLAASSLGIEYTPGVFGQASFEFVEAA